MLWLYPTICWTDWENTRKPQFEDILTLEWEGIKLRLMGNPRNGTKLGRWYSINETCRLFSDVHSLIFSRRDAERFGESLAVRCAAGARLSTGDRRLLARQHHFWRRSSIHYLWSRVSWWNPHSSWTCRQIKRHRSNSIKITWVCFPSAYNNRVSFCAAHSCTVCIVKTSSESVWWKR